MELLSTLLLVLFVALKLTGVITWSWWLVTIPFWGPIAALLFIYIAAKFLEGLILIYKEF